MVKTSFKSREKEQIYTNNKRKVLNDDEAIQGVLSKKKRWNNSSSLQSSLLSIKERNFINEPSEKSFKNYEDISIG
jgi:hypothetical protein